MQKVEKGEAVTPGRPPRRPQGVTTNRRLLNIVAGAIVFAVALGLMAFLEFNPRNPYLSEFDSYYHVKMAELIRDHGIPRQFPWLQFTTLRDRFVDLELLFHVLLIPFVTVLGPILGSKVFQILVVAGVFLSFFLMLLEREVKGAFWITMFSLFVMSSDFYYRMNFIRSPGLSILLLMGGMYLTFRDRPVWLGALAVVYVWTYGAFMFLLILPLTYVVAQLLYGDRPSWRLVVGCLAGMIVGLIVNPYFPHNIGVLFSQVFQTGLGAERYTGGEWHPYDTWYWAQINAVPIIIFFGAILLSLIVRLEHDAKTVTVLVFSFFCVALTWKSKRFIEYSPFFLLLSGFLLLKPFIDSKVAEYRSGQILSRAENLVYASALLAVVAFSYPFAFGSYEESRPYVGQLEHARLSTQTVFSMSALRKVHDYLLTNAGEGDIVFTDNWDVFPRYFFVNSRTYYIVGLDPEFMNQYDGPPYEGRKGELYREFAEISSGHDPTNLARIKTHFKAKWVIVRTDHPQFYRNLKAEPRLFEQVLYAANDREQDKYPLAQGDGYALFKVIE